MKLNIQDTSEGNLPSRLGIDDKRTDEIIDWVRHCWMSHRARQGEYSYSKLLRVTTMFCTTPEEVFLVGHILGRLYEADCSRCPAKEMLATLLAGIAAGAEVSVFKIPTDKDHTHNMDDLKERIKRDVN